MPIKTRSIEVLKDARRLSLAEEQVQQNILEALALYGYKVLSTSEHRRAEQCRNCGAWSTPGAGRGSTPGVPDLLVTRPGWKYFIGLEVKGPKTVVSAAQQELADAGHIIIVRSAAQALAALSAHRAAI